MSVIFCRCSTFRPTFNIFFFFNDTATTEIYTLSLHDALPILFQDSCRQPCHSSGLPCWLPGAGKQQSRNRDWNERSSTNQPHHHTCPGKSWLRTLLWQPSRVLGRERLPGSVVRRLTSIQPARRFPASPGTSPEPRRVRPKLPGSRQR